MVPSPRVSRARFGHGIFLPYVSRSLECRPLPRRSTKEPVIYGRTVNPCRVNTSNGCASAVSAATDCTSALLGRHSTWSFLEPTLESRLWRLWLYRRIDAVRHCHWSPPVTVSMSGGIQRDPDRKRPPVLLRADWGTNGRDGDSASAVDENLVVEVRKGDATGCGFLVGGLEE